MPTLPTITVTQKQADQILTAYAAKYGTTTTAATVAAYKKELAQHVIDTVLSHESHRIGQSQQATKRADLDALRKQLPDPEAVT